MKKNHIMIIDDGVNERYFDTSLIYNLEIDDSLKVIERQDTEEEYLSHATTCAGIIKEYAKEEYLMSSIKILGRRGDGKVEKFEVAMKWCIEHDIDIINMSMTTVS